MRSAALYSCSMILFFEMGKTTYVINSFKDRQNSLDISLLLLQNGYSAALTQDLVLDLCYV